MRTVAHTDLGENYLKYERYFTCAVEDRIACIVGSNYIPIYKQILDTRFGVLKYKKKRHF